ncbi:DUF551 domain-containing protein [Enterobacter ludwigii]|uniref:DUF551 domain-containing protein n=1 Tax=Enterobacter ludwigii TaxID=299767 RepID=UPI003D6FF48C
MSTITKEFTKEQLQQIIETDHVQCGEASALARIALASLEAEQVGCDACGGNGSVDIDHGEMGIEHIECPKCYAAPPAQVSVPDEVSWEDVPEEITEDDMEVALAWAHGFNQCRAAMLQGAEPVTTAYKLPDDFDFDRFNDVVWLETVASNPHMHSPTTSTIAMVALELNRKLAAGNSPVIPDGWVNCIERMPKKGERDIWLFDGEFVHHGYIWDGHDFVDWNEEYESITGITHWMKMALPAAPQQEVK